MHRRISNVWEFLNDSFLGRMDIYSQCRLSGVEFTKSMIQMDPEFQGKRKISDEVEEFEQERQEEHRISESSYIVRYGTKNYPNPLPAHPPTIKHVSRKKYCDHGFMETPQFWDDLVEVGNRVAKVPLPERNQQLTEALQEIN